MRTNNYKLKIFNKCPKCHKKLSSDLDIRTSLYGTKRIKNFIWKRYFIKTERGGGAYYFDEKFGSILKSVCDNFDSPNKNPQKSKMRVAKKYEDGRKRLEKTFNQIFCFECGWYEFSENATYIEVLVQK
jgi:hypothetical protein